MMVWKQRQGTKIGGRQELINGEIRMIAREVAGLEFGQTEDGYREIVQGVSTMSQVIVGAEEGLSDGDEVLVKGEEADGAN